MRSKALLLGKIRYATESWNCLASHVTLVEPRARSRKEFLEECSNGDLDGVVAIYRTFESIDLTGRFDKELVSSLPSSLRFVCHDGAGYDQIDVQACSERGIQVSHTPHTVDDSTADTAMFLILGALRRFNVPMSTLREGSWRGHPPPPSGHDPQGKVLGILGLGGIGRNLQKKAEVFGMRVIYYNRHELSEQLAGKAEYVTFQGLLARSDIISIHVPLNVSANHGVASTPLSIALDRLMLVRTANASKSDTRHLISTREFEQMKDGVVLINTARGAVIDEYALVKALDCGKVSSAGLDVYEDEPHVHAGLRANPNLMLLPHMGTWSVETQTAMEEKTISNVRSALETGTLIDLVPEQVTS